MGPKYKKKLGGKKKAETGGPESQVAADDNIEENDYGDMDGLLDEAPPPKWYDQFKDDPIGSEQIEEDELLSFRFEAQKVLDDEVKFYNSKMQKGSAFSDAGLLRTVLERGTAGDKLAAMVVSIQNSPVHNLNALNSLVGLVKVGKKRQCMEAMKVASQVFVEDLLRPDLKLRTLDRQPLKQLDELCGGDAIIRRKRLAAWAFEEKLKQLYNQFVMALATVSKDTLEVNREKSIATMSYLLESNPELEGVLLQNIINKLGDLSQKVVSKVIYCLTQLLRKHPNMKKVVMDETHKLLVRTNVGVRAQYYAICFLSQFVFTDKDRDVARHLITIYFGFFKTSIKMGEVNSRMMGALLMGVKRAYPFAKLTLQSSGGEENTKQLREHIDTLYKLVHVSKFNIALHTLALLHQVSSVTEDRFYLALYKKILDARLGESTHHALLINLLFKSLHGDENLDRVKAMIKRLLQICLNLPVPLTCGLLYMVSQLIKRRRSLACFETTAVPVLPSFLTEIKQEDDTDNLKNDYEDDGEEKYVDADTLQQELQDKKGEGMESESVVEDKKPALDCGGGTARGWYHCETVTNRQPRWANRLCYDGQARNPLFANADKTAYFELLSLANHFHPTVSLFANKILNHEIITYSGDPLTDFTLIRFLERFVFKNPKKTMMVKGMTNEQKGPDPKLAMRKYYQPEGAKSMPVTSKQYLSLAEKTVPVDELFLYKYLKEKYGEDGLPRRKDDDDNDSVASEEFEEMIDSMMKKSKKAKKKGETEEADEDDEEDVLDFMEDVGDSLKRSKKGNKNDGDDDEEDIDDDHDDSDDEMEDVSGSEDDGISDMEGGEDSDDVMVFSGGEDDGPDVDLDEFYNKEAQSKGKKKRKQDENNSKKIKNNKFSSNDLRSLFAPAEEFAEMLEETGAAPQKQGMAHTFVNKENAAAKQLNWESSRDRWVKGTGEHRKRKAGGGRGPKGGGRGPKGGGRYHNNKKFKFNKASKKPRKT